MKADKDSRKNPDAVALLDMDGTVVDLEGALQRDLNRMRSPDEPEITHAFSKHNPPWLQARIDALMTRESWWETLPKLELGFRILAMMQEMGFRIMVLTQGPRDKPFAWSAKAKWCSTHLPGIPITMTRDKSLVYGRVLVDDYPDYVNKWLDARPRGVVIMPANQGNSLYYRDGVCKTDGTDLRKVKAALQWARDRKGGVETRYPDFLRTDVSK